MRPYSTILTGVSIDGRISLSRDVSSNTYDSGLPPEVVAFSTNMRASSGAVMVGINTIVIDNSRLSSLENSQLYKIVVDSQARLPLNANVIQNAPENLIVATGANAPSDRVEAITTLGAHVIRTESEQVDLRQLSYELYQWGIDSIVIEGGAKLNYSLLAQSLVDRLLVVYFPFCVGNSLAPSLADGDGFSSNILPMELVNVSLLGTTHYVAEYWPKA